MHAARRRVAARTHRSPLGDGLPAYVVKVAGTLQTTMVWAPSLSDASQQAERIIVGPVILSVTLAAFRELSPFAEEVLAHAG